MKVKGFQDKDFALLHPGGSLGRRLLTSVSDVMHKNNLPICNLNEHIKDIVKVISSSKFGLIVVVEEKKIKGIITDGDIRRAMDDEENFFSLKAIDIMTKNPKIIESTVMLTEAQAIMTESKVNSLLVTKDDKLVGIVQIYDMGL